MGGSSKKVFVNGRFFTQKTTGVQRFAREIVRALDRLLATEHDRLSFSLVVPIGTEPPEKMQHIGVLPFGHRRGHVWEQIDLPRAVGAHPLINLCPSGPIFKRRQFTVIHDAAIWRHPENYSVQYRLVHQLIERVLSRCSKIGTVSAFSRNELAQTLGLRSEDIRLVPNGHEHILTTPPDLQVLDRLALNGHPFFLFVGSPSPTKNLERAIGAFASLNRAEIKFVIVGGSESAIFRNGLSSRSPNIIVAGRLFDAEIIALYQSAAALIFPSLYEGFGIPPLEAMALGCPVLGSNIPPIMEVCGEAALYTDPLDEAALAANMAQILASDSLSKTMSAKGRGRARMFSWAESARLLAEAAVTL